jgi:3-deoxy-D-manno-octulosonate 8-phosphate phosphatase (KDO 8-P phosphatase)
MHRKIVEKCKKIKIVLTDVDGVLTDGGMYYSQVGDSMKKFHVRDGMGVNILLRNGINTIVITKERTKFVRNWAKKMNISKLYDSVTKKEEMIKVICDKFNVKPDNLAYIGDDVNDIKIMKEVGLAISPNDATLQVKEVSDYVCNLSGGQGVFREVTDLILDNQFGHKKILY